MAITIQQAHELSEDVTRQLAGNEVEWRQFLKSAGNLYKYSFSDQLMTYAQRPDATATASYDTWNQVGRYVQRGSKGIALFREDGKGLKYVFDVSDTGVSRSNTHVLPPWKMRKVHTKAVFDALESEYGVQQSRLDYPARLKKVISAAVENSFPEMQERVAQEISGSALEHQNELARTIR